MTDEPKTQPDSSADSSLPESLEGDPKSETVIRRSEALKRMISAFQSPPPEGENGVNAVLDVDRSVEPAPAAVDDASEKTVFRPPKQDMTIASTSSLKKATDELKSASAEASLLLTETPPLNMAQDAARRLERKLEEPTKTSEVPPVEAASLAEAEKPFLDSWDAPAKPVEAEKSILDSWDAPVKPAASSVDAPPKPAEEPAKLVESAWDESPGAAKTHKIDEADKLTDSRSSGLVPAVRPEPKVIDATSITMRQENALTGSPNEAPWTLQQFFNGEIDLDVELSKRFPTMPMLSIIKFRTLGTNSSRRVATLSTQDGAASLIVGADVATKVVQMSFTLGSMLTLRFGISDLSDMDRNRWVELMRRDQGGLAFLWGPTRWADDYMICIARKYFTNLYCFSPHNFEAGVRLTPAVTKQLLDWLEELWKAQFKSDEDSPPLLTW
jgi:hypothetical protein